ncbi:MAG: hypothetical protein E6G94_03860 [Alphaproteobacteria bacterium]|nr:MAG: hypothetical protein E6G94_03860 [Alphaproteobacteria bacterium]
MRPFDRSIRLAEGRGDLVTLGGDPDAEDVYRHANGRIVEEAESLGDGAALAIAVWEGRPHGTGDATADFVAKAAARGFALRQVRTDRPEAQG